VSQGKKRSLLSEVKQKYELVKKYINMSKTRSKEIGLFNLNRILIKVAVVHKSAGTKIKELCLKISLHLMKMYAYTKQSLIDKSRARNSAVIKKIVVELIFLEIQPWFLRSDYNKSLFEKELRITFNSESTVWTNICSNQH
jgi:hypothetical protein